MDILEYRIAKVMETIRKKLSPEKFKEIFELYHIHGEYGVALENLCSIFEEDNICLDLDQKKEIIEIFKTMRFPADKISYYEKKIKTQSE